MHGRTKHVTSSGYNDREERANPIRDAPRVCLTDTTGQLLECQSGHRPEATALKMTTPEQLYHVSY
jgi:hypothetical protein